MGLSSHALHACFCGDSSYCSGRVVIQGLMQQFHAKCQPAACANLKDTAVCITEIERFNHAIVDVRTIFQIAALLVGAKILFLFLTL